MTYHFTRHAKNKFILMRKSGFQLTSKRVTSTIVHPLKIEDRTDGTKIALSLLDERHVLRVVYRVERDIIIVITFYPGRRKAYEI